MRRELERAHFRVVMATSGAEALAVQRREVPDLILLDLTQPDMDGLDVCRRMRTQTEAPLVIVTARSADLDRVLALELGADDYLTVPYDSEELMARVRAALRRADPRAFANAGDRSLQFNGLTISRDAHVLLVGEREIPLTPMEAKLLWVLAESAGHVLTSEHLLDEVWGYPVGVRTRTLDVHIGRLRKKLDEDGRNPRYIVTVPRVGYKFQPAN